MSYHGHTLLLLGPVQHEGLGGAFFFFFDVAVSPSDSCIETVTSAHMLHCEHGKHRETVAARPENILC